MRSFKGYDPKRIWTYGELSDVLQTAVTSSSETMEDDYRQFKQITSKWFKQNPVGIGVHWVSPMEISIRGTNLLITMSIYYSELRRDAVFLSKLARILLQKGELVCERLEIKKSGLTTNHTTANFAFLLLLSIAFPSFYRSKEWKEIAVGGLEYCIMEQVYEDGVDFEGSTRYHYFVMDILAHAAYIANQMGVALSKEYFSRLRKMFHFALSFADEGGHVHAIGDNDSRLWLSPAGMGYSYVQRLMLTCFPGSDSVIRSKRDVFYDAGIAVLRNSNFHCVLSVMPVGQGGLGGHNHEDLLQFCMSYRGLPVLVDPGTLNYNENLEERIRYRRRESHGIPYMLNAEHYFTYRNDGPFDLKSYAEVTRSIEIHTMSDADVFALGAIETEQYRIERKIELEPERLTIRDSYDSREGVAVSQLLVSDQWEVIERGERTFRLVNRSDRSKLLSLQASESVDRSKSCYSKEYDDYSSGTLLVVKASCQNEVQIDWCLSLC
jgi:hypothetical protein